VRNPKITAKGQTTIPIEVREFLGLEAGDRIGYEIVDGKVTIVPKNRSALEFAGILHAPDRLPVSVEDMNRAMRLITPEKRGEDIDATLRPQTLDDFTGQAGRAPI
jgi:antitoxin PrlF